MNTMKNKGHIAYLILLALLLIPLFATLLPEPMGSKLTIYMPPYNGYGFIFVALTYIVLLVLIGLENRLRFFTLLPTVACGSLLVYALYVEYELFLMPCNLCILQRVVFVAIGLLYLIASFKPVSGWGRKLLGVCALIASGIGVAIAGRHVWMQGLPPELVPDCGPSLQMMLENSSVWNSVASVLSASGNCADIQWDYLGLSMPTWTLICFIGLFIYTAVWMFVRINNDN